METLSNIEAVETDNKDKPIEDIVFQDAQIFTDPFAEVDEVLAKERADAGGNVNGTSTSSQVQKKKPVAAVGAKPKVFRQGVGRYIDPKRK